MFFRGGQYKNGIRWRFFQCFEECVESRGTQHVNLIHNIYFVFAGLWCKAYLLYQRPYIIYRVVAGGIEFMNIERSPIVERHTAVTGVTGFSIGCTIFTVNGFGKYAGTGSFAHTPGATE